MNDEVQMIPIERVRILNPRHRDRKKFEVIVQSIKNLGLKKPIQVSLRDKSEEEGPGYDLVCGQGRIEAFTALGHKEIPAIVVEINKEDRLLRSLVENMARRTPPVLELINEIQRLKERGHSNGEISRKLDVDVTTVANLLTLRKAGEERLLEAALSGRMSWTTCCNPKKVAARRLANATRAPSKTRGSIPFAISHSSTRPQRRSTKF